MDSLLIGTRGSGSSAGGLVEVGMGQRLYFLKAARSLAEREDGKSKET